MTSLITYISKNWSTLPGSISFTGNTDAVKKVMTQAAALEGKTETVDSANELAYLLEKAALMPDITIVTPDKGLIPAIDSYFSLIEDEKQLYYDLCLSYQIRRAGLKFSSSPTKDRDVANCDLAINSLIKNEGLNTEVVEGRYQTAVAAEVDRVVSEEFAKVSFTTTDGKYNVTVAKTSGGYDVYFGNSAVGFTTLSVKSLPELSQYGFTAQQIKDCKDQADNIPAAAFNNTVVYPFPDPALNPINVIAKTLTDFLTTNDKKTADMLFNSLAAIQTAYFKFTGYNFNLFPACEASLWRTLDVLAPKTLSDAIAQRSDEMLGGKYRYSVNLTQDELKTYLFPTSSGTKEGVAFLGYDKYNQPVPPSMTEVVQPGVLLASGK